MRAAVFDVDGTLLDSMSVWEDIGERYLADHKIAVRGNLRNALRTMSLEQGAAWLKEEYQKVYSANYRGSSENCE